MPQFSIRDVYFQAAKGQPIINPSAHNPAAALFIGDRPEKH